MAGSVLIVTDSVGSSGMNSSPWVSLPRTASSLTQCTMVEDKVRCSQAVSCSQETDYDKLPMYSYFATAWFVMPGLVLRQA